MQKELRITQSYTRRDSLALARYFNEINSTKPLTPDEEVELSVKIKHGDMEARNKLVQANLRFVVSVAKQYQNLGIALEDLINEGNIGLIRAAERFDPTRGFKFDTFAVWWIRQAITSALAEISRTIRLPLNVVGQIAKIRKAASQFEQEHQRMPSVEELSAIVHMPESQVKALSDSSVQVTSLDNPLSDDSDSTLSDVIVSSVASTDSDLMAESLSYNIDRALSILPARERNIIQMSFGLNGAELSLDDIAIEMHITRERVRQLREKAIRSLRREHCVSLLNA